MKGRPPLEPRIKNVEELCEALAGIIKFNEERIAAIELINKAHQSWTEDIQLKQLVMESRIATLERQIAQMMESFKNGNIPLQMAANYKSNFDQWPSPNGG